ncbi:MAG: isoaspartyl peptidase/L-asparaginase [Chitinophagales bacterium]|nr:isoaspartyl peptidase/L-asparaginase [Chitinophagales bacterium]MDW8392719.1 isoaspartyl peptidase/L-asparaginase [Chitinophagales bacterium]
MSIALAIHGGAGVLPPAELTTDLKQQYEAGLRDALRAGFEVLLHDGSAVSAVERAVQALEDHPLFNAGRGAVFNHMGQHELDASIMDGRTLRAGAVCAVSRIKNPVCLARLVMERSEHVLLCGEGAEQFAAEQGMEWTDPSYFFTQRRYDQFCRARQQQTMKLDDGKVIPMGTVGAVACDRNGNVAAATSTGGITNKRYGRVGDSPLIGAGTYANNATCAVSCTGHGEFFIRYVVAYDVHCLMAYRGLSLQEAARLVVMDKLLPAGGEGGLIAADNQGRLSLIFNGTGMYRAWRTSEGTEEVAIY